MEYYTLLTIVYTVGYTAIDQQLQFSILFPSEDECWSVLTNVNTIYDKVNATEGYCRVTEFASKIVKPAIRPW